jgi:hypothetical protein
MPETRYIEKTKKPSELYPEDCRKCQGKGYYRLMGKDERGKYEIGSCYCFKCDGTGKKRMTIKRAKELAKEKLGRYPRIGHELMVEKGYIEFPAEQGKYRYETYLSNEGGKFRVWTWYAITPS